MSTQPLMILGAGTFAMEVADLVSDATQFHVEGFCVNQLPYEPGKTLLGKPIYWIDDLTRFRESHLCVCAIGSTHRITFVRQAEESGMRFATVIHPTARVSRQATVGVGSVISAGVVVSTHTQIGKHVILNRGALIGHHETIHDFVTISPGANIAGSVTIGTRAYVGLGAMILETRTIGELAVVAAGSLVTHDVAPRTLVMGTPARVVKENVEGH